MKLFGDEAYARQKGNGFEGHFDLLLDARSDSNWPVLHESLLLPTCSSSLIARLRANFGALVRLKSPRTHLVWILRKGTSR